MQMRKGACAALAVMGLAALVASPASAQGTKKLEPLNQYVVSGKIDPEDLARAGQDLSEGGVKSHKGAWVDRKSTRLNSSHVKRSRMPSSA